MFVRNLLQAGDHVTIVPTGVRISLQYSENGLLEKVYQGYADNQILHQELLTPLLQNNSVPRKISITKGTSFVYGCLYTDKIYPTEGRLDKEVEYNYLTEYLKDPSNFVFYAGHIQSYAVGINLPMAVHRWLAAAGFNVLPGYVVPPSITEGTFSNMLNLDTFPFNYPRIQSYIKYRVGKYEFVSTKVKQIVVKKIKRYTSYEGFIMADIYSHDLGVLNASYTDIVKYNIHPGSILLVNEENSIIDCYNPDKLKNKVQPAKINCEYCGKVIIVPSKGKVCCADSHCSSVILPHVEHMLNTLSAEMISRDEFMDYAKEVNHIVALPDILDLDKYKDKKFTVEISKLLYAVVPVTIIPNINVWDYFCSSCNNSVDSVKYYIQNPDKIMDDLNIDFNHFRRLHHWLQDPQNVNDVIGMIEHENIEVVASGKKFEGAPIFRGKSIYITGTFAHGNLEDIKSILSSYSAEVYDKFNTAVDCVIIGDLHERTSGRDVNKAKQMRIPIFEEKDFFAKYDIDNDLRKNVV